MLVSWKIVVVIHDNKEFAKFEEERVLVRWEKVIIYNNNFNKINHKFLLF